MPGDTSNFTQPDTPMVFNPKTGKMEPRVVTPTQNNRMFGGFGRSVDQAGNEIAGTSGGEIAAKRYQSMGAQTRATPSLDVTRSNETRGFQLGALDTLRSQANGTAIGPAERLAMEQGQAAQNSSTSMAASVRGGAAARAAAARAATASNGQAEMRYRGAADAARAGAMATARGQLAGVAACMRGNDLDAASANANLEMGQRGADQSRKHFYEGLGFDTAAADDAAALGLSASDQAARASEQASSMARDERSSRAAQDAAGTGASTVVGGVRGYMARPHTSTGQSESDRRDIDTSDMRAKQDVRPLMISDARAKRDAFIDGVNSTQKFHDTGEPQPAPDYMASDNRKRDMYEEGYAPGKAPPAQVAQERERIQPYSEANEAVLKFSGEYPRAARPAPPPPAKAAPSMYENAAASLRAMLSDVTSKEPTGTMPLYAPEGTELHMSDAGRGYLASQATDAGGGASFRGPTPRYGSAPKAVATETPKEGSKPKPKTKPRKLSDAELDKLAKEMQGYVSAQKETLKDAPAVNPMADANRSMVPSSYAYKPGFAEEAGQQPGERNVGPMAQNMAADPVASTAIAKRPDGMLAIDKDKGLKLVMGGLSGLQAQVDQLEAKRRGASA